MYTVLIKDTTLHSQLFDCPRKTSVLLVHFSVLVLLKDISHRNDAAKYKTQRKWRKLFCCGYYLLPRRRHTKRWKKNNTIGDGMGRLIGFDVQSTFIVALKSFMDRVDISLLCFYDFRITKYGFWYGWTISNCIHTQSFNHKFRNKEEWIDRLLVEGNPVTNKLHGCKHMYASVHALVHIYLSRVELLYASNVS